MNLWGAELPTTGSNLKLANQIFTELLTLKRWFRFDPAVGSSATQHIFIKFGPLVYLVTLLEHTR